MAERILFSADSITSPQVLQTTASDMAVEAKPNAPLAKRINPFTQKVTPEGLVVNPDLDKDEKIDVSKYFCRKTERDRKETRAAEKIRTALLEEPDDTLAVWLSPPYEGRNEGRITVGHIQTVNGIKKLNSYGFPTEISPDHLLHIGRQLDEFADSQSQLDVPEDLRSQALIFPLPSHDNNPWEFLATYIPMPEVWDAIISGKADREKAIMNERAHRFAAKTYHVFQNAQTEQEKVNAVYYAVEQMSHMGLNVDVSKLDCELPTSPIYTHMHTTLSLNGRPLGAIQEKGGFVKECPHCGREYNEWLPAGFVCKGTESKSCGQIYEGC